MESMLLVLLGFFLGLVPGWWTRKQRLKMHWCALRAEIAICTELAETYLNDKIMAPLYRLPTKAFSASFPALLADAALNELEVKQLSKFYELVEQVNRGLDYAAEYVKNNNIVALSAEYNRLITKVNNLVKPHSNSNNMYTLTVAVIERHF